MGDINYDGEINNDDITLVNKFISGISACSNVQRFLADINGDGKVNGGDILLIKRMIAGLI